jgi:hypothetical protein
MNFIRHNTRLRRFGRVRTRLDASGKTTMRHENLFKYKPETWNDMQPVVIDSDETYSYYNFNQCSYSFHNRFVIVLHAFIVRRNVSHFASSLLINSVYGGFAVRYGRVTRTPQPASPEGKFSKSYVL